MRVSLEGPGERGTTRSPLTSYPLILVSLPYYLEPSENHNFIHNAYVAQYKMLHVGVSLVLPTSAEETLVRIVVNSAHLADRISTDS